MRALIIASGILLAGAGFLFLRHPSETSPSEIVERKTATTPTVGDGVAPPPPSKRAKNERLPEHRTVSEVVPANENYVAALEQKVRENPSNDVAVMALVNNYLMSPTTRYKAEPLLKKELDSNPENKEALDKFLELQRDGGPGKALQSLNEMIEQNPDSPNLQSAYAKTLAHKGQTREAIPLLEKAIAKQIEMLGDLRRQNLPTSALETEISRSQSFLSSLRDTSL